MREATARMALMGGKRAIVMAVRVLLTPIVQVLTAIGFHYRDFVEAAKSVYVEVALDQDRRLGRKTSFSRIARDAGITRREVSRLNGVVTVDPLFNADYCTVMSSLLHVWHNDAEFLDGTVPRRLPLEGDQSLATLIHRFRGALSADAVVRELVRVGAIDVQPGHATALLRNIRPKPFDALALQQFASVVHDVGNVMGMRLLGRTGESMVEPHVVSFRTDPATAVALKELVAVRTDALLADARTLQQHAGAATGARIGIVTYLIDGD